VIQIENSSKANSAQHCYVVGLAFELYALFLGAQGLGAGRGKFSAMVDDVRQHAIAEKQMSAPLA
jgi:hypothetical protein